MANVYDVIVKVGFGQSQHKTNRIFRLDTVSLSANGLNSTLDVQSWNKPGDYYSGTEPSVLRLIWQT